MTSTPPKGVSTRWILDLDYDADPEVTAADLRADIEDQFSLPRGRVVIEPTRLIFWHGDDALTARLRYNDHVTKITSEAA